MIIVFLNCSFVNSMNFARERLVFCRQDSQDPSESNAPERSEFVTTGTLTDRSDLSDEMAELCKKVTIYIVKEKSGLEDEEQQAHLQRKLNCN